MPIKVVSLARYVMTMGSNKSRAEWDAATFVRAIKGDTLGGTNHVTVGGERKPFNDDTRDVVFGYFATLVYDALDDKRIARLWKGSGNDVLVPVPSSKAVRGVDCSLHSTQKLVAAASEELGWPSLDCLRWTEEMPSARKSSGGVGRDGGHLAQHLEVTCDVEGRRIILIDDVVTSGAHISAAAHVLREAGATVELAVCAGNTVYVSSDDPFTIEVLELADLT